MDVLAADFEKAHAKIWSQAFSFANCASIKCAVQLGIPDAIDNNGKPMTLSELANSLQIKPSKAQNLHRLMAILVKAGFFTEEQKGDTNIYYGLTSLSHLLLEKEPMNLKEFALLMFDPIQLEAWNSLSKWFKKDEEDASTPFETAHGKTYWDKVIEEPKRFQQLCDYSKIDSELVAKYLVTEFKFLFDGVKIVIDVGCGTGEVAQIIAKTFPNLKSIMFDEPYVVAKLEKKDNLDVVPGNIFEKIPSADALILKWMLHNWNDEDCVKILKKCKEAIQENGGKVIIIDPMSKINDIEPDKVKISVDMNLNTMILFGTKIRTEKEYATLFKEAGFSGYKVYPFLDIRSVIVVSP